MTEVEDFVVAVAKAVRTAIDEGATSIQVEHLVDLFEEHFDMKGILG